jgi:diacylglycerol kinase family enzyme
LPNGSGNDTCTSMGVMNLSDALDYIVNGEVIAIDTIKCLVDYDKEEDIPAQEYNSKCRHMIINGCLAMPARVVVQAQKYKACCGKMCYSAASIEQSLTGGIKEELLYVEVDGKPMEPISTIFMMFFNGSYTGGGLQCEPFACMNDGLLDLTFLHNTRKNNLTGVADLLDKAKKGGVHIFDRDQTYVRGKHIKVRYGGVKNR